MDDDSNDQDDETSNSPLQSRGKDDSTLLTCTSNCRCISLEFIKTTAENVKKEYERLGIKKLILKGTTQRQGLNSTTIDTSTINYWVYRCAYIFKQVTIDHILLGKELLNNYESEVEYDPVGLQKEVTKLSINTLNLLFCFSGCLYCFY